MHVTNNQFIRYKVCLPVLAGNSRHQHVHNTKQHDAEMSSLEAGRLAHVACLTDGTILQKREQKCCRLTRVRATGEGQELFRLAHRIKSQFNNAIEHLSI